MSNSSAPDPRQVLNQFGLVVLGLVVGSALLFFAIGTVGASDDPGGDEPVAGATTPVPEPTTEGPAVVVGPSDGATTPTSSATTPGETPTSTPSSESTPDPDRVDPAEISVQVLDAKLDGSSTAQDATDQLEADGYNVVASITASRVYDQTTVFYSEGREALGQQVADDYGWTLVRANDVGLSEQVDVAVVVGVAQN